LFFWFFHLEEGGEDDLKQPLFDKMEMDAATERVVQVRFTTKLPPQLRVVATPFSVPAKLTRYGLSDVVNSLLGLGMYVLLPLPSSSSSSSVVPLDLQTTQCKVPSLGFKGRRSILWFFVAEAVILC
jgi:hypothetical protein